MILDKKIKIKVNSAQLKNLINKGLKVSVGDEIEIPINYLSNGSNIEINCECDVCGVVKKHTTLNLNKQKIKLKILLRGIMVLNILVIVIRIRKKLKIL